MSKSAFSGFSNSRRGSIYLITVITVAAIAGMVLIGVSLRSSSGERAILLEEMSTANIGVLSGTEYALELMATNANWRTSAQSGVVFNEFEMKGVVYNSSVLDAATGLFPTYDTTTFQITSSAGLETAQRKASIEVDMDKFDYKKYVKDRDATHYWAMDEWGSPATAYDSIKTYDGSYLVPSVAAKTTNDEGAPVPVFADANDSISVPWNDDFNLPEGAFAMWVNCKVVNSFSSDSILGMEYSLNGNVTFNVSILKGAITAYIDDDNQWGWQNFTMTSMSIINPGVWYHIAVTWGDKGLIIYLDGVEKAKNMSNVDGLKTANSFEGGHQPLHIGSGYYTGNASFPKDGFRGSIAHVALFDKQLTSVKVAQLAAVKPDTLTYNLENETWARVFE